MRKEITIFVYDNQPDGSVLGDLVKSYDGGDCAEMQVLLPEGWDAYRNDWGLILESPSGLKYFPKDCLKNKYGVPYLLNSKLEVLSSERRSIAFTMGNEE